MSVPLGSSAGLVPSGQVKSFVLRRIRACCRPGQGPGRYSLEPGGPVSLAASCDAALLLHVTDQLPEDPEERKAWIQYLDQFQDPKTGWYLPDDESSRYAGPGRMPMWLFGMVLRALNALGGRPRHPLFFLTEWCDQEALRRWMRSGRDIMHMGIVWLRHLRRAAGPGWAAWRDAFFELLEQDEPWTRVLHPKHQENWNQVCRARGHSIELPVWIARDPFHTLFAYYAGQHRIPHVEALIDWFLLEQDESGFFTDPAPYSHMDGLSLLASLSQITRYRCREIQEAARRALAWTLDEAAFAQRWDLDLHLLLARCETIAAGLRILPGHPFAAEAWRSAWDLDLWRIDPATAACVQEQCKAAADRAGTREETRSMPDGSPEEH